jgi:hypothetical protein
MRTPIATGLSLALLCLNATAATLTFQQGVDGYAGTRDTELRFPEPDLNSGGAEALSIDYDDGPGSMNPTHGLLAFDGIFGAGPGQVGATDTIINATLTLEVFSAGSGWSWHEMLQSWDEDADTWNSRVNGIQADGVEAVATAVFTDGAGDGNGNIPNGTYSFDVTGSLQEWQSGALANNGWAILPIVGGTNGIDFDSSESTFADGATRPLLTVETAPVPVPAAFWLMGTAVLGVGAMTRRPRNG